MSLTLSFSEAANDERYRITDMDVGGFTFSVTALHNGRSTRGHEHPWPEIYVGLKGRGALFLGNTDKELELLPGSYFVIPGSVHHRVYAYTEMEFACFFTGERHT